MSGLTARMSSTSMPNFLRCPGRKLVRKTSERRANSYSTSLPSGTDISRPTLRLRRLACSMFGLGSPSTRNRPVCRKPRCGSPVTACSTLTTSAPPSASTAPADGTNPYMATSRTRIPSSGPITPPPERAGQHWTRTHPPPTGYHPQSWWPRPAMAYRSPQHVDNFILTPGESYIPGTRIQPNERNETGILGTRPDVRNCQHLRRKNGVSRPPCERLLRESKVLIIGREILCA